MSEDKTGKPKIDLSMFNLPKPVYNCEDCMDTGWCGDNGPGIRGNREYHPCHCRPELPSKEATIKKLKAKLAKISSLALDLPGGIDENADLENDSPEDMTAHIGGLIYQIATDDSEGS